MNIFEGQVLFEEEFFVVCMIISVLCDGNFASTLVPVN